MVDPCSDFAEAAVTIATGEAQAVATPRVGSAGRSTSSTVTIRPSMQADEIGEGAADVDADDVHQARAPAEEQGRGRVLARRQAALGEADEAVEAERDRRENADQRKQRCGIVVFPEQPREIADAAGRDVELGEDHAEHGQRHRQAQADEESSAPCAGDRHGAGCRAAKRPSNGRRADRFR